MSPADATKGVTLACVVIKRADRIAINFVWTLVTVPRMFMQAGFAIVETGCVGQRTPTTRYE